MAGRDFLALGGKSTAVVDESDEMEERFLAGESD
jgi:hypothetical protein